MFDTQPHPSIRHLRWFDLRNQRRVSANFALPTKVLELPSKDTTQLISKVTKLVPSKSSGDSLVECPIHLAQRALYRKLAEQAIDPNLKAYCAALSTVGPDQWNYFAKHYQSRPGDAKLDAAYAAFCKLFPKCH